MNFLNKAVIIASTIGLSLSPALSSANAKSFNSVIVFGDSLVDAGNAHIATGGVWPSSAAGYFNGRFTNGYDYVDLLSKDSAEKAVTTPSLLGGNNFAMAGARVVWENAFFPNMNTQIDSYVGRLAQTSSAFDANSLYILNFGANDVRDVANDTTSTIEMKVATLSNIANQYAQGVQRLSDLGARNIMITDLPVLYELENLGANIFLYSALNDLDLTPDTGLYTFSYAASIIQAAVAPQTLGLPQQEMLTSCQEAGAVATGCDGYFSFDGSHPTAQFHHAMYEKMNRDFDFSVAGVPEPATWLLMIMGFGMVGAAMRRRGPVSRLAAAEASPC